MGAVRRIALGLLVAVVWAAPARGRELPCDSSRLPVGAQDCSHYGPHEEGRAVDWKLDYNDPRDRRQAGWLLWMFRRHHNELAKRMGIQGILWHCHWWDALRPDVHYLLFASCRASDTRRLDVGWRHDNHMHIELNWAGAKERTSFWRVPKRKWSKPDRYRFDDSTHCTHRLQPGARALLGWLYTNTTRGGFEAADGNPPPGERCLPSP
jgi:hypothetical protein